MKRCQGIPQSHTTWQTTHQRFIGKENPGGWLPLRGWEAAELNRTQDCLYRVSWGGRNFQKSQGLEGLYDLILGQPQRLVGFFSPIGWDLPLFSLGELGMSVRATREVWAAGPDYWSSSGGGLAAPVPQGVQPGLRGSLPLARVVL